MKEKNKDKNIEKPKPSFRARVWAALFNLFFLGAAAVALYIFVIFIQMPSLDAILHESRQPAIVFLDRDGREIRSQNKIMGAPVSMESLPKHVWQAIVAIEDKRFFSHGAIDMRGMFRALVSNLMRRGGMQGGSTLTQQTAKNIFLSSRRTTSRKVQELILSYWLENRFTKNQILDLYMNRVSLAGGLRGLDAAARLVFGKPAAELTIAESAQIAAMLKAPTAYNPVRNPGKNIMRARLILAEMVRQKYISLSAAQIAAKQLRQPAPPAADKNIYRYWTDFVMEEVQSRLGEIDSDLFVRTTLDSALQESAAAIIARAPHQAAVLAMSRDGAIRAMVGGADYQASQFNRVLAPRQPGSTFKIATYLVALEHGMTPRTIVNDSPFAIGDYNPRNYNEKYYGDIALGAAFAKSANSVPLKLAAQFGIDEVLSMAGRMGVGSKLRREYSTILGASEMTLMDLTTLSAVVWNDGQSVRPYSITKISTAAGREIYSRRPSDPMRLLQPQTIEYMREMLRDVVVSGTGKRAVGALGGKTGTSNDYRDAWFIGATSALTIGVWVGKDDNSPMDKITGGTIPAEIFRDIVK